MNIYRPSRVLWISTRITYTFGVVKHVAYYNFVDYRTHKIDADRVIIQLESMLKLAAPAGFIEDTVPTYDLIILGDIESIYIETIQFGRHR